MSATFDNKVALSGNLVAMVALSCLISVSASMAIVDVTIDACIARNSIEVRSLASDLQSLCGFCSSSGALIGYSSSGFFVHHLGPQRRSSTSFCVERHERWTRYYAEQSTSFDCKRSLFSCCKALVSAAIYCCWDSFLFLLFFCFGFYHKHVLKKISFQ